MNIIKNKCLGANLRTNREQETIINSAKIRSVADHFLLISNYHMTNNSNAFRTKNIPEFWEVKAFRVLILPNPIRSNK